MPLQTFDSEFSYIEVWLFYQNSKPLEIQYNINITLVLVRAAGFEPTTTYFVNE